MNHSEHCANPKPTPHICKPLASPQMRRSKRDTDRVPQHFRCLRNQRDSCPTHRQQKLHRRWALPSPRNLGHTTQQIGPHPGLRAGSICSFRPTNQCKRPIRSSTQHQHQHTAPKNTKPNQPPTTHRCDLKNPQLVAKSQTHLSGLRLTSRDRFWVSIRYIGQRCWF